MPSSPLVQFSLQTPTFFSMKRQRERVNERGKEKWRDEQKSFRTASRIVTFQQGDNSKCSGSLEHFMPLLFLSTRWFSSSKVYISPPPFSPGTIGDTARIRDFYSLVWKEKSLSILSSLEVTILRTCLLKVPSSVVHLPYLPVDFAKSDLVDIKTKQKMLRLSRFPFRAPSALK